MLTMPEQPTKIFTARDLLYGFLELRGLTPELDKWTEENFADNPPRLFRLRRLQALFWAFEIPWDPASFRKGEFIAPENPLYNPLLTQVAEEQKESVKHGFGPRAHQLPYCFETLLNYRERVESVLQFSSGVLEASGLYRFAHKKAGELNHIIREHIGCIDDILVGLIYPAAKTFTVEELTRDYNFPDVNLSKIDADWW
jgi:hypothetical protein